MAGRGNGMSKVVTEQFFCDVCRKECGEHNNEIRIAINGGDGRDVGPSVIYATVYVNHPYVVSGGLVCAACCRKWLQKWLERATV